MKQLCILTLILSTSLVAADDNKKTEVQKKGPSFKVVWKISEGLKAPESIYHDADSGFLFLSQIGEGGGAGKDGDGWISKISVDGKMIENKWVTGFNAPKGLRSHGGTLWVSDIDRVVAVDIAKGEIKQEITVPDAKFLNDLATDSDGNVYVSDMVASRVIKIANGKAAVFLEGEEIQHPNGLLVDGDSLILGGWGKGFNEDFSTDILGQLQKVNLKTKERTAITAEPTGYLDGIEADGHGGYIVTDWRNGKLFHISKKGKARVVKTFPRGLADHAYLVDQRLLILPEMLEGTLTAYRYGKAAKKSKK